MPDNFCQRVINSCEKHSAKTAMRIVGDEKEIYTFGEMLKQIRSVAYRLEQEKIEFGDRVALIGENHPCWAIAYLGTLFRGAVCVPIDPHGEIETITNFLENSETKLAFLSPHVTEKFRQIEERLGRSVPAVVWRMNGDAETRRRGDAKSGPPALAGGFEPSTNGSFQRFEDWVETDFPESFAQKEPPAELKDTALLMYTSGTTGTPKGVPLTHGNIIAELDGINRVLKLDSSDKILSLLPLFHAYLQIVNLWTATTYGCEAGYLKELTPDELGKAMREFKPTILTTVPRLWYLFHKKIFDAVAAKPKPVQMIFKTMLKTNGILRDTMNVNLGEKFFGQVHESFGGNLRFAITAGSRFDESVAEDFYKLGFTIIQGYGLTETSGAATATYESDNRVGSVGKPFFNAEVKLDNPNAEGIGEVLIRGAMVFDGYYKNPQATKESFTEDGWFRSGDLGKFDKDGHLYIVGRAKDVIVLPSGKNVHPEDLEVHYLKSPLVEEMAILGVEDKSAKHAGAEKLVAVVVPDFNYLKQAKIANSQVAIRYDLDNLGRELPEYQRVKDYIIRTEPLPRTATRKIKRFELQKELEGGDFSSKQLKTEKTWEFSEEDKAQVSSNIGKTLVSIIKQQNAETETVHPAMNLEIDLGLDSLARAEVFAALEQKFGFEFDTEEATEALTVGEVINLTQKHTGTANAEIIKTDFDWGDIVQQAEAGENLPEVSHIVRNRVAFPFLAFTVYKIFNLICRIFFSLEVRNAEVLEKLERPFLITPNHQSFIDPFVVTSNYPFSIFKHIFHVGAAEYFKTFPMTYLGKWLNVVPINPDTQLIKAMKAGAVGLKHGKVLNIYPEGERAFDGDLHQFKKGAAILSTELDLPIVPVAIDGLYKVWARRSKRIRFAKIKVRFGKPIYPQEFFKGEDATNDETRYERLTAHLKETIAGMIDEMRK